MKRRTIARTVRLDGAGLLSRSAASAILKPGAAGQGIVLNERIKAELSQASVREHTTCLGRGRHQVGMVEHLLAACAGLGITDVEVEVAGGELPFLDGSSRPFVAAMKRVGLIDLSDDVAPLTPVATLTVRRGCSSISVQPASRLSIACRTDLPGVRPQEVELCLTAKVFELDVAPARTFGRLDEAVAIFKRRHRLGFALTRRDGIVCPARERMSAEPVRHKILDLIGDLWLLGRPLHAHVRAISPSHELNIALARELEAS